MFVPYGRIYSLDAYEAMLGIGSCIGAKHSSLSRQLEWDRLAAARRGAARLPGVHRQRPRHRHGHVRLRLPARAVDVRARGVRRCATGCGRPAIRASTSSTTCCSTSGTSRSARPCPATATTRRCSFELRGLGVVERHAERGAPAAASRTERCSPTSSSASTPGHRRIEHERAVDAGQEARLGRRVPRALRVDRRRDPGRRRRRSRRRAAPIRW